MMKRLLKSLLRLMAGNYEFYRIYRVTLSGPDTVKSELAMISCNLDPAVLLEHSEQQMRSAYSFCRAGAISSFAHLDDQIIGVSTTWDHTLAYPSLPWLIGEGECILVNIVTAEPFRGRGIAPALIEHQSREMSDRGFRMMYCWIWWTNWPSIRAFRKAGWRRCGWSVIVRPFGRKTPLILRIPV